MADIHVCDECGEPKRTPYVVQETDGSSYDICSSKCYSNHVERMRRDTQPQT
jgi:ribosomal protein L24E